jgi:ABC-2 type transport system permease protein
VTPYLAICRARGCALLQYRAAALAGLGTQVFWGIIRMMIFMAFYASTGVEQPMRLEEVITYVWLGQALLLLVLWRADPDLAEMVRTGNVAYELLKPVDLYGLWYAREVAARVVPTLMRSVPLAALALACLGMAPPASVAAGVAFALSLICAVLLSAAFTTIASVLLLWTISGRGATALMTACTMLFSGMIIPLPLFPDWAQPALNVLPFRGLVDVPFRLYLGHLSPAEAPFLLAHQLLWTAALVLLGRWLLRRARRRLVVQGG